MTPATATAPPARAPGDGDESQIRDHRPRWTPSDAPAGSACTCSPIRKIACVSARSSSLPFLFLVLSEGLNGYRRGYRMSPVADIPDMPPASRAGRWFCSRLGVSLHGGDASGVDLVERGGYPMWWRRLCCALHQRQCRGVGLRDGRRRRVGRRPSSKVGVDCRASHTPPSRGTAALLSGRRLPRSSRPEEGEPSSKVVDIDCGDRASRAGRTVRAVVGEPTVRRRLNRQVPHLRRRCR